MRAVDGVAEAPAAHGLQAMMGMLPVLRAKSIQAGVGIAARTDRADDNALAFAVAFHVTPELLDDAHRLVPDGEAAGKLLEERYPLLSNGE